MSIPMYDMEPDGSISQDGVPIHLGKVLESLCPSDWFSATKPERPYSGQPHTDMGERGRQQVEGLTMRGIRDCFILACFQSSGLAQDKWPTSVYDLPWAEMDIIAVSQNLTCEIERRMGIYPNVPPLEQAT